MSRLPMAFRQRAIADVHARGFHEFDGKVLGAQRPLWLVPQHISPRA
jgi:hypothetical protein